MMVRRMNPMQRAAYRTLYDSAYRRLNAPTGSGKSSSICYISARELDDRPSHRVVIAVPQTILGKGFQPCRLQYPDTKILDWNIGYDLTHVGA